MEISLKKQLLQSERNRIMYVATNIICSLLLRTRIY